MKEKQLDLICMGRVAVDLYSQQIGARLEDASSFARYLGGSSGNVALWHRTPGAEIFHAGARWRRAYGALSARRA
ncbi:Uncharacterized protein conserved in bacteria [Cedecea neteri]|uniref:Uncharacterized protein conserved in bacteria n=1 Tax=Cedecea neteri TaxID=158822 RepID=A0A2X2T300_9ENTR|nr:Uncharacterized protein conserved in bacteria [Cedecea neteri]